TKGVFRFVELDLEPSRRFFYIEFRSVRKRGVYIHIIVFRLKEAIRRNAVIDIRLHPGRILSIIISRKLVRIEIFSHRNIYTMVIDFKFLPNQKNTQGNYTKCG